MWRTIIVWITFLVLGTGAIVSNEVLGLLDQMSELSAIAYCESLTSPFDCDTPICARFPGLTLVQVCSAF